MLTPLYVTRTIAAGARAVVTAYGRHILVVSISASTVRLGIQDDPPQDIISREHIDCEGRRYDRLVLQNTGAVPSTVVIILSETWVDLQISQLVFDAMLTSLTAIDTDLDTLQPPAAATPFVTDPVTQTGVGNDQVIAAAAANKRVLVQADQDNAGSVYVGFDNTVTAATAAARLLPGESWGDEWAGDVYVCSENGTEGVRGYVLATV